MSRFNFILVGIAIAQLIVIFLLSPSFGDDSNDASKGQSFMSFDPDDVHVIEVDEMGSTESIKIQRSKDGWVLPDYDDFPVLVGKLTRESESEQVPESTDLAGMIDKLSELEVRLPLVKLAKNHQVMNVADDSYSRRITLMNKAGKKIDRVFVARGSNSKKCYIRRESSDDVYETDQFRHHEFSPLVTNWSGRQLINVDPMTINQIAIKSQDESQNAVLVRNDKVPTDWKLQAPVQEKANAEPVNKLLRKLCSLNIEDILGKEEPKDGGFDDPLVRYELTLKAGGKEEFIIGKKLEDGDYTAYWLPSGSRGSGYYVQLSAWAIQDAVETKLSDMIVQPDPPKEEEEKPSDGNK